MDSIGDGAGVSFATLYKHFPGKEILFSEADGPPLPSAVRTLEGSHRAAGARDGLA
ncbi:TetR family transcriptional regulator [Paraburkholderia sp. BR13439]|uniref:TetR family transcriptional regulator n=1 Tax=Paraburkholderia sp. BR13439 TaxID=3236996 RepID=UPI0034CE031B